jgi:hypothetical protein
VVSPSLLLMALVLFPLPWIEVRCNGPVTANGPRVVAEQSGWQAARGTVSERPLVESFGSETERKEWRAKVEKADGEVSASWCAAIFAALAAAGLLGGVLLRAGERRRAVVMACGLGAGLVLLGQMWAGFPVERELQRAQPGEVRVGEWFTIKSSGPPALEVRYTVWLWLSVVAVLGAGGVAAAELRPLRQRVRKTFSGGP